MSRALVVALLGLLALAAPAEAALVASHASAKKLRFRAFDGEVNRLAITQDGQVVRFTDGGAPGGEPVEETAAPRDGGRDHDRDKGDSGWPGHGGGWHRPPAPCVREAPNVIACTVPGDGWSIQAELGDGNDSVVARTALPVKVDGGVGDDALTGGDARDILAGGPGRDTLEGGAAFDSLEGGAGDDTLRARDGVKDGVLCQDGADAVDADLEDDVAGDCEAVTRPLAPPTITTPPPAPTPEAPLVSDAVTPVGGVAPSAGATVAADVRSGRILVRRPDGGVVALDSATPVPVGATVDARAGVVTLTVAKDLAGGTQTAEFTGGRFTVEQTRGAQMTTVLRLRGRLECGPTARSAAVRRDRSARRLWGSGHGRFTTRGRNSAATVRGTIWSVEDRCDRTTTTVERGAVSVRDLGTGRTTLIRAGDRYVARKRTARVR